MSVKFIEKDLELVVKKISDRSSLFSVYPLPPGMGYTLAGPLRRIIYAVEKGFRIRHVSFSEPTVLHPYAALPGVSQDAQEILLRLKDIVFKPRGKDSEEAQVSVSLKGKKVFKAGDIDAEGFPFEVVNPEYVICDMDESVQLTVELTVSGGTGYVTAEEHEAMMTEKNHGEPVPGFAVDTIYTPVINVKTNVENVLAGKRVDYEKLTLEVLTNGSIDAYDVWKNACEFLSGIFLKLARQKPVDSLKRMKDKQFIEEDRNRLNKLLTTSIDDLPSFPRRVANCFGKAGYKYLKDVILLSEKDLLAIPNLGQKCLDEYKTYLEGEHISLGGTLKKGTKI